MRRRREYVKGGRLDAYCRLLRNEDRSLWERLVDWIKGGGL